MSAEEFLGSLGPILDFLQGLNLSDAAAAEAELQRAFPPGGGVVQRARELFGQGVRQGWLCDKAAGTARFSRVAKASEATRGFSVDAVRLSGPGVWHRHTTGEVDLCFSREGEGLFDGRAEGWVVFSPGSAHVPTASGGTVDIVYFLPRGEIAWK